MAKKTKAGSTSRRGKGSLLIPGVLKPPPALSSPDVSVVDRRVNAAVQKVMGNPPGSHGHAVALKDLVSLEFRHHKASIGINGRFSSLWPPGLYIPSNAKPRDHWPFSAPPAGNRYALDWTSAPVGSATADRRDGFLLAMVGTPTVRGAINGSAEAGLGVIFTPKYKLGRVRIEPELNFTGRFRWDLTAPSVVRVTSLMIGSLFVGGYRKNLVTGQFESLADIGAGASPWRRHEVSRHFVVGMGAYGVDSPFKSSGNAASVEVLVEGGFTYLLSVVAQAFLRVETTDDVGKPIVTQGTFNTWASMAGVVREIWLHETKLID
jgi:hypothetical protein